MERDEVFEAIPPDRIERLARLEGQTNFWLLLAGVEIAPDTTDDAGALSFARVQPGGCIPETLDTHVAQSTRHDDLLRRLLFDALDKEFQPKPRDRIHLRGAIVDALEKFRCGKWCPRDARAKQLRVDKDLFDIERKAALRALNAAFLEATPAWERARFGQGKLPPRKMYAESGKDTYSDFRQGAGCFVAPRVEQSDERSEEYGAGAFGMRDRLGWDDRNAAPGPVTVYPAQPTAAAHAKADVVTAAP